MTQNEWSLPLGNWLGGRWRISWLLLTVCLIILTNSLWRAPLPANSDLSVLGPVVVLVFFFSLMAREIVDWLLCLWRDVAKGDVCIGPLGNMISRRPTAEPRRDMLLALAGPGTHLLLGFLGLILCVAAGRNVELSWLNPITPPEIIGKWQLSEIGLTLWTINWSLCLIRLLPAAPLDGQMILLSFVRILRPGLSLVWASLLVRHLSLLVGSMLLGFSFGAFIWSGNLGLIPDWLVPACLSAFLVWSAVSRWSSVDLGLEREPTTPPLRKPPADAPSFKASKNSQSVSERNADWSEPATFAGGLSSQAEDDEDFWDEDPLEDIPSALLPSPAPPDPKVVDGILEKIFTSGKESLTDEEKEILAQASEHLKQKRNEDGKK
jgi:hypothetical protein